MHVQVAEHIVMPTLVLEEDQSSWMMFSVPQVLISYWSVRAGQFCHTTASTLLMLVWDVKVLVILSPEFIATSNLLQIFFCKQLHAQMVSCDWQEEILPMKAEWRSA